MGGGVSPLVKEGGWCVYASFVYTHNCADSVGRRGHSILFSPEHCLIVFKSEITKNNFETFIENVREYCFACSIKMGYLF